MSEDSHLRTAPTQQPPTQEQHSQRSPGPTQDEPTRESPSAADPQQQSTPSQPPHNFKRTLKDPPAAATPTTAELPRKQQGLTLRSGTILPGPQQVSPPILTLREYLDSLLEEAREPDGCSVSLCDAIDKRLAQTREKRRAQIQKLKTDTERFRTEILQLEGFSRPLTLVDKSPNKSVSFKKSEISVSESNTGEIVIGWLDDSLQETSSKDTSFGTVSFAKESKSTFTMADYAKVAKLTAQLVPLFSGEPHPKLGLELQTFLGCCNQVIQCLPAEDQAAFLQIFPTRLRGEAYQLFASNIPTTFKEVEERLNRAYLPRETYQELVNKLITIRQYPLETLTTFVSKVKQLLILCKEAADSKYSATESPVVKKQLEDFAKNALKTGVSDPHLCQYLLTIGDETVEELIQKALDMERLQQSAQFLRAPFPFYPPPTQQFSYTQPSLPPEQTPTWANQTNAQWQQTSYPQFTPALNPRTASSPKKEPQSSYVMYNKNKILNKVTCSFCNLRGHTYADCLKRKNTPYCVNCRMYNHDVRDCRRNREIPRQQNRPSPNQPPQKATNSNDPRIFNVRLKCEFCGRNGHDVNTCPHKLKWENKSQGNDKQSTQNSPARL